MQQQTTTSNIKTTCKFVFKNNFLNVFFKMSKEFSMTLLPWHSCLLKNIWNTIRQELPNNVNKWKASGEWWTSERVQVNKKGTFIAYSMPHYQIFYKYFHATWIHFCDMVKYSLLMCKIFCHMDKGSAWKYKLFSCTKTHFGFCDLFYDYVLVKKDICN